MEPDIIFEKGKAPVNMPPYNWRELGLMKNVAEENHKDFFEKEIYQILPIKYLVKILTKGTIRFMNIVKFWHDPYELFMLKQNISIDGIPFKDVHKERLQKYYGQCWSLTRNSDAMWRIYSYNFNGVRIKTTVGKMIKALNQTRGMTVGPYFGKVKYLTKEEIFGWLESSLSEGSGQLESVFDDSLFIKRKEFEHENEMRFVLYLSELKTEVFNRLGETCDNVHDDFVDLEVDPFKFIDEIAFDPRLNAEDFSDWKNMLSTISGNIPIVQSDLYEFQPISIALKRSPMHIALL